MKEADAGVVDKDGNYEYSKLPRLQLQQSSRSKGAQRHQAISLLIAE